jgi:hypothetical protein
MRIGLRKPHSGLGQLVHVGCVQIFRSVAIHIQGPLIIREKNDNIGLIRGEYSGGGYMKKKGDSYEGQEDMFHLC